MPCFMIPDPFYAFNNTDNRRRFEMEFQSLDVMAGYTSSLIFILSNIPMLTKAIRTRNLRSYSFGQICMANGGNLLHWIYIFSLPLGPIWFLHGFHSIVAFLMFIFYVRFELQATFSQKPLFWAQIEQKLSIFWSGKRSLSHVKLPL